MATRRELRFVYQAPNSSGFVESCDFSRKECTFMYLPVLCYTSFMPETKLIKNELAWDISTSRG